MIVNLIGKKYKVPELAEEVSFGDYVSINTYLADKTHIAYEDKLQIMCLLMKCPYEVLEQVLEEDINMLYSKVKFLNDKIEVVPFKSFRVGRDFYSIKDINFLSVKEYLSIDYYFRDGETVYENLDRAFAVLVRAQNKSFPNILKYVRSLYGKNFVTSTEEADHEELKDSNVEHYADLVSDNFSARECIYLLNIILELRSNLQAKYKMIFEEEPEEEAPSKNEKLSVAEIWSWYHVVNQLVDNDKQKFDYWYSRPIEELFTHLAYQKQLGLEQIKR